MGICLLTLFIGNILRVVAVPLPGELTSAKLASKHEAMLNADLDGGDILGYTPTNEGGGYLWPKGVIPYVIDSSLARHSDRLIRAMEEFHNKTCIRFQNRTKERNYLQLQNGNGCNSYIGMHDNVIPQPVNLAIRGCLWHSTIVHELGHAIGLRHTHQRMDRDDYITVNMDNVEDMYKSNFYKHSGTRLVPYDTTSVMHYNSYAASKNGKPTMLTKSGGIISDPKGLSDLDALAINRHYKC